MARVKQQPHSSLKRRRSEIDNEEPVLKKQKIGIVEGRNDTLISLQETLRKIKDSSVSFSDRMIIALDLWENSERWESISKNLIYMQLIQWISFNIVSTYKNRKKEPFFLDFSAWDLFFKLEKQFIEPLVKESFVDDDQSIQETKVNPQLVLALGEFITTTVSSSLSSYVNEINVTFGIFKLILELEWFRPAISVEQYSKLLICFINTILSNDKLCNSFDYLSLMEYVIKNYSSYLNQQANHKKVFTVLLTTVYQIAMKLIFKLQNLSNDENRLRDVQLNVISELKNCISNVFFGNTDCSHYGDDKQLVSYHHQLYDNLKNLCKKDYEQLQGLSFLLQSYIVSLHQQTNISQTSFYEAHFFYRLYSFIIEYFKNNIESKSEIPLSTSNEIFEILIKYNVNIPNKNEYNILFSTFVDLAEKSISNNDHSIQWESLTKLLEIQHDSVISCLQEKLYPKLFLYQLEQCHLNFLIGVMELYSKLHQSQKFIEDLFQQLEKVTKLENFKIIHDYTLFWIKYSNFISKLSPYQEFELVWNLFLSVLSKWKRKLNNIVEINVFELICNFFSIYIDNIIVNDGNAKKVQELITSTCNSIILPVIQSDKLLEDSDFLSTDRNYSGNMLISILNIYSSLSVLYNNCESLLFKSYHSSILQTGFTQPDSYFYLIEHKDIPILSVLKLFELCKSKFNNEPAVLYTVSLITIQRIYTLHSCSISIIEEIRNELKELSSLLIDQCIECWNSKSSKNIESQTWNRNPFSISSNNIGLAMFSLISANLFYLCQYLSKEHIQEFLIFIFSPSNIHNAFMLIDSNNSNSQLTFSFLLKKLLENDQFYELHSIRNQVAFTIKTLITKEIEYLNSKERKTSSDKQQTQQTTNSPLLPGFLKTAASHAVRLLSGGSDGYLSKIFKKDEDNMDTSEVLHKGNPFENLITILGFVNALPKYYLIENHWMDILSLIFIVEEIVFTKSSNQFSSSEFQLLCECRRTMIHSLSVENIALDINTKEIRAFYDKIVNELFINSCNMFQKMNTSQKDLYQLFCRKLFAVLSLVYLQTNNGKAYLEHYLEFKNNLNSNSKESSVVLDMLLLYLTEYLLSMVNIVKLKEEKCISKEKQIEAKKALQKIQDKRLKIIEHHTLQNDEDNDSTMTDENQIIEIINQFSIDSDWIDLEKQIYSHLIELNNYSDRTNSTCEFLGRYLECFGVIIEFDRFWYSRFLNPLSQKPKNSFSIKNIKELLFISMNIIQKYLSDSEKIIIEDLQTSNNIYNIWNSIKESDKILSNSLLYPALKYIESICRTLRLPICSEISEDNILKIMELIFMMISSKYLEFQESFNPNDFFDSGFEILNNESSSIKNSSITLTENLLNIFTLLGKNCTQNQLKIIVEKLELKLQNVFTHQATSIMCLYQLFSSTQSK